MSLRPETKEQAKKAVQTALELGINFFDTADVYGPADSELILGEALRESRIAREAVVIASKCGIVFQGMNNAYTYKAYDLSPGYIKTSCEASLQRLGVDYIDLYQPHRIDYLAHPDETARALEDLKSEGKIRHIGVSNHTVDEIRALSAYTRLESLQTQFSLLHLEPLETGLAAVCLEKGLSVLCWSPLHRGVLTGKRTLPHGDWQKQREQGVVAQLRPFAETYGITLGQLSLAWLMQLPGGVIPLVGTANADHIAEAAGAVGITLARDDWYELMVIGRGRPMPWGQRPYIYLKER
jgi:aryl-alcohol dehydrogenase-like predicted oxidoreductase